MPKRIQAELVTATTTLKIERMTEKIMEKLAGNEP